MDKKQPPQHVQDLGIEITASQQRLNESLTKAGEALQSMGAAATTAAAAVDRFGYVADTLRRRRTLFSKIASRPARRPSFRRFWRKLPAAMMQGQPRRVRRAWALERYRQVKRVKPHAQAQAPVGTVQFTEA